MNNPTWNNPSFQTGRRSNIALYAGVILAGAMGSVIVILEYLNQHREIIKFLEKKTAPYLADQIYLYVKGEKFVKVKNNLKDYLDIYDNYVHRHGI